MVYQISVNISLKYYSYISHIYVKYSAPKPVSLKLFSRLLLVCLLNFLSELRVDTEGVSVVISLPSLFQVSSLRLLQNLPTISCLLLQNHINVFSKDFSELM